VITTALLGLGGHASMVTNVLGSHLQVDAHPGVVIVSQEYHMPEILPHHDDIQRSIWFLAGMTGQQASCHSGFRAAVLAFFMPVVPGSTIPIYARPDRYDQRVKLNAPPAYDKYSFAPLISSVKMIGVGVVVGQYYMEVLREVSACMFESKYEQSISGAHVSEVLFETLGMMHASVSSWVDKLLHRSLGDLVSIIGLPQWVNKQLETGGLVKIGGCWASMLLGKSIKGQCSWIAQSKMHVPADVNPMSTRLNGSADQARAYKRDVSIANTAMMLSDPSKLMTCTDSVFGLEKYASVNVTSTDFLSIRGRDVSAKLLYVSIRCTGERLADRIEMEELGFDPRYDHLGNSALQALAHDRVEARMVNQDTFTSVPAPGAATEKNVQDKPSTQSGAQKQEKNERYVGALGEFKELLGSFTNREDFRGRFGARADPRPTAITVATLTGQKGGESGDFMRDRGRSSVLPTFRVPKDEYDAHLRGVTVPNEPVNVYSMPSKGNLCGVEAVAHVTGDAVDDVHRWLVEHNYGNSFYPIDALYNYCEERGHNVYFLEREHVANPSHRPSIARLPTVTGDGSAGVIVHGGSQDMHYFAGRVGDTRRSNCVGTIRLDYRRAAQ